MVRYNGLVWSNIAVLNFYTGWSLQTWGRLELYLLAINLKPESKDIEFFDQRLPCIAAQEYCLKLQRKNALDHFFEEITRRKVLVELEQCLQLSLIHISEPTRPY